MTEPSNTGIDLKDITFSFDEVQSKRFEGTDGEFLADRSRVFIQA